jgi:hypothetical protein
MSSARAALVEHQVPLGGMSIRNPQRIDRSRLLRRQRHVTIVLGITVAVSVVLVLAPVTAWLLGRDAPDTLIGTFPDALWWAMETISTVGYGDIHPVTTGGRVVAAILIVLGIAPHRHDHRDGRCMVLNGARAAARVCRNRGGRIIERTTLTQVLAELEAIRARLDHLEPQRRQ